MGGGFGCVISQFVLSSVISAPIPFCKLWFLISKHIYGLISFTFFSSSFLAIIIWWPQPKHFNRKSAPILKTSHSLLPQGCCFFNLKMSPTWISISLLPLSLSPFFLLYLTLSGLILLSPAIMPSGYAALRASPFSKPCLQISAEPVFDNAEKLSQ